MRTMYLNTKTSYGVETIDEIKPEELKNIDALVNFYKKKGIDVYKSSRPTKAWKVNPTSKIHKKWFYAVDSSIQFYKEHKRNKRQFKKLVENFKEHITRIKEINIQMNCILEDTIMFYHDSYIPENDAEIEKVKDLNESDADLFMKKMLEMFQEINAERPTYTIESVVYNGRIRRLLLKPI